LLAWLLVLPWPASAGDCAPRTIIAEVMHVRDGDIIEVGGAADST
jgi:endonuclease YncB( thermonuclease family)